MKRVQPRVVWGHRGWWMPQTCGELRAALRAAGVVRISGRPLGRVRKAQLAAVWRRMMEVDPHPRPLSLEGRGEKEGLGDGMVEMEV